jgi:hypothetical protein
VIKYKNRKAETEYAFVCSICKQGTLGENKTELLLGEPISDLVNKYRHLPYTNNNNYEVSMGEYRTINICRNCSKKLQNAFPQNVRENRLYLSLPDFSNIDTYVIFQSILFASRGYYATHESLLDDTVVLKALNFTDLKNYYRMIVTNDYTNDYFISVRLNHEYINWDEIVQIAFRMNERSFKNEEDIKFYHCLISYKTYFSNEEAFNMIVTTDMRSFDSEKSRIASRLDNNYIMVKDCECFLVKEKDISQMQSFLGSFTKLVDLDSGFIAQFYLFAQVGLSKYDLDAGRFVYPGERRRP